MGNYAYDSVLVQQLDQELTNLIKQGINEFNESLFNELALREFAIQYHNIDSLREFSNSKGLTPESVISWEQIPALNPNVFKDRVIAAFPLQETELTLMTSGTSNPRSPGKIYRDKRAVEMYYLANQVMTRNYLFPDVERMKILLMVPSPKLAPAMGMAVGLEQMRQNFGTKDSMYLITPNGMEWELLFSALHESEAGGEPVAIVGATSGLIYFFNFCQEKELSFQLPAGSRICDGGGYLGTFGECSREEYLQFCAEILGVPAEYCVNTLGSAESATNYFDNVLRNHYLGIKGVARYKECPPWARTIVVHPQSGQRLPKGEIGQLCHYDLVNRSNLMALQTGNLGYEIEAGFEITGRVDAADKAAFTKLNTMISQQNTVCSTVADGLLKDNPQVCSTVADQMLEPAGTTCSTAAVEMLSGTTPHGNKFNNLSNERLERLRKMCPFLKLQGLLKKA